MATTGKTINRIATWPLGLTVALVISLTGCHGRKGDQGVNLQGRISGFDAQSVLVCKVENQHYDQIIPIDTLPIENGVFRWQRDTIAPDIYAFSFQTADPLVGQIVYALLGDGRVNMEVTSSEYGVLNTQSKHSAMQNQYEEFMQGLRKAGLRHKLDSVEWAFAKAREVDDTVAMATLKVSSMPLYDKADLQIAQYLDEQLVFAEYNFFTFYLYYTYDFMRASLLRQAQVDSVRSYALKWQMPEVQTARMMQNLQAMCAAAEKSVVAAVAPEIVGCNPSGDTVRLSDFRGRYVLVDFWASYCSWCRMENPVLTEAYSKYTSSKGVEFISVTLDRRVSEWLTAVEEDGNDWVQVMPISEHYGTLLQDYNIQGIPLILLIDDQGVIVARGLRGEDIASALEKI